MVINEEDKSRIEIIISKMEWLRNFVCYKSSSGNLNEIKIITDGERIECLRENPLGCKYELCYESLTLCQCPICNYIARNFEM
jgi:hypothetical protein